MTIPMQQVECGQSESWLPVNSQFSYIITPYCSVTYSIQNEVEGEEVGSIVVVDMADGLYIEEIKVNTPFKNKEHESKFVEFVQIKHHDVPIYIKPSNGSMVLWLANLGFEPVYIEDWSKESLNAPWEVGYKEMVFIPNPSVFEKASSFYKRFLMALSNYVGDISDYEPIVSGSGDEEIMWEKGGLGLRAYFKECTHAFAIWGQEPEQTMVEVRIDKYEYIDELAEWFSQGEIKPPSSNVCTSNKIVL